MRRVVPRAGVSLLCAAVLAIAAMRAGPPPADPGTGVVTTDTTRPVPPPPRDGTITTDPSPADTPGPDAPSAESLPAEPPPAGTPLAAAAPAGSPARPAPAPTPGPPARPVRPARPGAAPAPALGRSARPAPAPKPGPPAWPGPAPAPAPGSIRAALLAPASGAWFGFYAQTPIYSQQAAQTAVTNLEAATGRTADIDHWYEPWGDTFPTWRQPWDVANGRIPMISWGKQRADAVLSGADDDYIAARADGVKALGKPVFLRWFWEMAMSDNLAYSQSPAAYVAAWRHIHAIFTARGATNVAWVWCPNASSFKNGSAQRYYPGDDVVDWICADGYNFYPDSSYREFEPIFDGFYVWASQRPKPLMIAEYGDQAAGPGQRAAWLDAAHAALVQKFPRILAVVYFHSDGEHDWTLYDEPDALAAFRRMALDPYFNPPPIHPRR